MLSQGILILQRVVPPSLYYRGHMLYYDMQMTSTILTKTQMIRLEVLSNYINIYYTYTIFCRITLTFVHTVQAYFVQLNNTDQFLHEVFQV